MKKIIVKITAALCLAFVLTVFGCGKPDDTGSASEKKSPLTRSAPENFRVIQYSAGEVILVWDYCWNWDKASWGADIKNIASYYNLYYSNNADGPYQIINGTKVFKFELVNTPEVAQLSDADTLIYSVKGLAKKSTYYFKVCAWDYDDYPNQIEGKLSDYVIAVIPDLCFPPDRVNVTLLESLDGVHIEWNAVEDVREYAVYRYDNSYKRLGTTSGLFFEDNGLLSGQSYSYSITSVTGDGEGPKSNDFLIKLRPGTPVINTEVSVLGVNISLRVSWEELYGAESYKVYRSNDADGTYALLSTLTSEEFKYKKPAYTDAGIELNKFYYYKVSAVNTGGESSLSLYNVMYVRPAPESFEVKAKFGEGAYNSRPDYIKIDWDVYPDAEGYKLYRSTDLNGEFTHVGTPSTNTFSDSTVKGGTRYYYKVSVITDGYGSAPSSSVAGELTRPDAPTGLYVRSSSSLSTGRSALVEWNSVQGAVGYHVSRDGTRIATTTSNYYNDTLLTLLKNYQYTVTAYNSSGVSYTSNSATTGY